MYTGSLGTVSNREDWIQEIEVVDENGDDVDISAATITIAVRKKGDCSPTLTVTDTDGITVASPNFTFTFTLAQTRTLYAGQYEVGCTVEIDDETTQLFVGTVTIVDGVVS